jgi:hypothetical protein
MLKTYNIISGMKILSPIGMSTDKGYMKNKMKLVSSLKKLNQYLYFLKLEK